MSLREKINLILGMALFFYAEHLLPILWVFAMWLCLTSAAWIFIGDFWRAAGIVSALTLFNMLRVRVAIGFGE